MTHEAPWECAPETVICRECQHATVAEQLTPGQPYRCPGCARWLYREPWPDSLSVGPPCPRCLAPTAEGSCLCGRRAQLWRRCWRGLRRALGRSQAPAEQKIEKVRIDRIELEGFEPRLSFDVRRFLALRHSIEQVGMIQPLLLQRGGRQQRHGVISGLRRLLVARQLGWREVPARLLPISREKADTLRLAESIHWEALTDLESAEAFERYFLGRNEERRELSDALGLDDARIEELLSILRQPRGARESMIYGWSGHGSGPPAQAHDDNATESETR